MATVVFDDHTVNELQTQAAASGMTVDAYVKLSLSGPTAAAASRLSLHDLESPLSEHAFDGPTLPADFSRADIYYGEHD